MASILILTGPPGAGKSTTSRHLAGSLVADRVLHMHTDDMYGYVAKGFVAPWRPESQQQNDALMRAMAASAAICAESDYLTLVDGIVGPWFLEPWRNAAAERQVELHYVALLPSDEEAVARGTARTTPGAMTDPAVIRQMCAAFREFPLPERHIVDSTGQTAATTAIAVQEAFECGRLRLA